VSACLESVANGWNEYRLEAYAPSRVAMGTLGWLSGNLESSLDAQETNVA
jgi:hypothetical protein